MQEDVKVLHFSPVTEKDALPSQLRITVTRNRDKILMIVRGFNEVLITNRDATALYVTAQTDGIRRSTI